jgi:DNA primase
VTRSGSFGDAHSLSVKVALLPAGHDPDTFLRSQGAGAFAARLSSSRSLLSYAVERALGDAAGVGGPRTRTAAFTRVAAILAKVNDSGEALELSRDAARRLGVDPAQLWIEAQRLHTGERRPAAAVSAGPPGMPLAERELLSLVLHVAESRRRLLPLVEETDLSHPGLRALLAALKRRPDAAPESLMGDLADDLHRGVLGALLVDERDWGDASTITTQFQSRFDLKRRLRRIRQTARAIAEEQASGDASRTGVHAGLAALQREGEEARGLTQGLATVPLKQAGPTGPQGVHANG